MWTHTNSLRTSDSIRANMFDMQNHIVHILQCNRTHTFLGTTQSEEIMILCSHQTMDGHLPKWWLCQNENTFKMLDILLSCWLWCTIKQKHHHSTSFRNNHATKSTLPNLCARGNCGVFIHYELLLWFCYLKVKQRKKRKKKIYHEFDLMLSENMFGFR